MLDGIKNLWKWKSIIWKSRWWDYSFLIDLMKFQLQIMIDNWDESHYVGSNFTKLRMIILLKRLDEFDEKLDELFHDYIVNKKYTKDEYNKLYKKMIYDTWYVFGKNIRKFWD